MFAAANMWWTSDGKSGRLLTPPDPDAWDQGIPANGPAWYAGGSDGTNIYQLAIDSTGQWWIDKFDGSLRTLRDRWEVTGWTSAFGGDQHEAFFDVQHVCASSSRVTVIADKINSSLDHIGIDVANFDLNGTLVFGHSILLPSPSTIEVTGSCTDGDSVYFWTVDYGEPAMFSFTLSTVTFTILFFLSDLNAQSPDPDTIYINPGGIVLKDGDLIMAGGDCVARAHQDGTLVWITRSPHAGGGLALQALAHSGRGSVWAAHYPGSPFATQAEEYRYDGAYVQTIDIPETAIHAWLGGPLTG
jgi:hypothetical protein